MLRCNIIVAKDLKNVIGYKKSLAYRLPTDMKYFKHITQNIHPVKRPDIVKNNAVLMGYNTWDSIPAKFRPLDYRYNSILTRNNYLAIKNMYNGNKNIFINLCLMPMHSIPEMRP